ncbi:hypothetical protein SK128_016389, partial [Halocaridina rubra]
MSAQTQEDRQFITECIQVYRQLPALWKVKSEEYRDRNKKKESYDILIRKFRERCPQADRETVKKKFNSLRTNFRKELKKVADSVQAGGEIYESNLWYFNDLLFLEDQDLKESTPSTDTLTVEKRDEEIDEGFLMKDTTMSVDPFASPQQPDPPPNEQKHGEQQDQLDQLISMTYQRLKDSENEYLLLAKSWAIELSKMDKMQQLFAKKCINDILFAGQLGILDLNSFDMIAAVIRQ